MTHTTHNPHTTHPHTLTLYLQQRGRFEYQVPFPPPAPLVEPTLPPAIVAHDWPFPVMPPWLLVLPPLLQCACQWPTVWGGLGGDGRVDVWVGGGGGWVHACMCRRGVCEQMCACMCACVGRGMGVRMCRCVCRGGCPHPPHTRTYTSPGGTTPCSTTPCVPDQ